MGADKPRVVVDTNALVAARFRPHGAAARLLEECINGKIQVLISEEIGRENQSIIRKVRPPEAFLDRLDRLYAAAIWLEPDLQLDVTEDPADNRYLECAVAGGAGYIVTSDRHLLVHDGFRGIRICRAGRLLEELEAAHTEGHLVMPDHQ